MRSIRSVVIAMLAAVSASGCATHKFGRVVTEVTVSPADPRLLLVRACDLLASKESIEEVKLGDCKRIGVRRSAIVPVPVVDARVVAREGRLVTGFFERDGGGATITTCRIDKQGAKWALVDCAETGIATAPLGAAPAAGGAP